MMVQGNVRALIRIGFRVYYIIIIVISPLQNPILIIKARPLHYLVCGFGRRRPGAYLDKSLLPNVSLACNVLLRAAVRDKHASKGPV